MDIDDIQTRLLEYFKDQGKIVAPGDNLFATDVIDSMGVIELVLFSEETLGVELDQTVMTKGNFETLEKIAWTIYSTSRQTGLVDN